MIFKSNTLGLKLAFFENTDLPESIASKDDNGKTIFTKTGKKVPYTTYTFRDQLGEKLIFLSNNDTWRALEGELVDIEVEISYDDYKRTTKTRLASVSKA